MCMYIHIYECRHGHKPSVFISLTLQVKTVELLKTVEQIMLQIIL